MRALNKPHRICEVGKSYAVMKGFRLRMYFFPSGFMGRYVSQEEQLVVQPKNVNTAITINKTLKKKKSN